VAEALVARHDGDPGGASAAVAAHYESAGLPDRAIPHYARAAAVAQALYAHEEAEALARRALALVDAQPAGAARDLLELELRLVLVPSCRVTLGWAAPALEEVLVRALALCDRVGTPAQRLQVLYGMQSLSIVAGRLEQSVRLAEEVLALSREAPGAVPVRGALAMAAGGRIHLGRLEEASAEIDRLLLDVDRGELARFHEAQGINYEIHGRAWQAHALWCLGRPDAALERGVSALTLARELGQPFSQAIAATYLALLQELRGHPDTFRRQAEEALELATEFKATYYRAWAAILVAHAEALAVTGASALARLRDSIEAFEATGARLRLPYFLALLAGAHRRAGDVEGGLAVLEEAMARSRDTRERWWDADLHRLRGEILVEKGDVAGGEAALGRALDVAREQRARSLELRAAHSLARLWAGTGREPEARRLLEPVYRAFTEGLDTPDLQATGAFLAELGQGKTTRARERRSG
jgi:predicted ATPase